MKDFIIGLMIAIFILIVGCFALVNYADSLDQDIVTRLEAQK